MNNFTVVPRTKKGLLLVVRSTLCRERVIMLPTGFTSNLKREEIFLDFFFHNSSHFYVFLIYICNQIPSEEISTALSTARLCLLLPFSDVFVSVSATLRDV